MVKNGDSLPVYLFYFLLARPQAAARRHDGTENLSNDIQDAIMIYRNFLACLRPHDLLLLISWIPCPNPKEWKQKFLRRTTTRLAFHAEKPEEALCPQLPGEPSPSVPLSGNLSGPPSATAARDGIQALQEPGPMSCVEMAAFAAP